MENILILQVFKQTLWYALVAISVITLPGLITGIIMSIMQAATQLNETSLTFIPKLIVMMLVLMLVMPHFMQKLIEFTQSIIYELPNYLR